MQTSRLSPHFPDHLANTFSVGSPWANLGFLEEAGDEEVLKHSSGELGDGECWISETGFLSSFEPESGSPLGKSHSRAEERTFIPSPRDSLAPACLWGPDGDKRTLSP